MNFKSRKSLIVRWKENRTYYIMIMSILFFIACYIFNKNEKGTWSEDMSLNAAFLKTLPDLHSKITRFKKVSKGQLICRQYLEKTFKRPFPEVRPKFLKNEVTGHLLEIDCYNEELNLGVEYDGGQHDKFNPRFHRNHQDFQLQKYRDREKDRLCKEYQFNLIRVPHTIPHESIENYLREQLQILGYL